MAVEVKLNEAQIRSRFKMKSASAAAALAEQILSDSTPFVPDDGEHTLRGSGRVETTAEAASIIWGGSQYGIVYAAYQWYGCWPDGTHVVKRHTTAGTSTRWVYKAMRRYKEVWDQVAQRAEERL